MKNNQIFISSLFALVLVLAGCTKNSTGGKMEQQKFLTFSPQLIFLDSITPVGESRIFHGIGDYRIILPKQMEDHDDEAYSDKLVSARIGADDTIVVERTALTNQILVCYFMVVDSAGAKGLIAVDQANAVGRLVDMEKMERLLLNDPDYWQNYP